MKESRKKRRRVSSAAAFCLAASMVVTNMQAAVAFAAENSGGTAAAEEQLIMEQTEVNREKIPETEKVGERSAVETNEEKVESKEKLSEIPASIPEPEQETQGIRTAEDGNTGTFLFGTKPVNGVTSKNLYSEETGFGFSDLTYPEEAAGWQGNVYYPRNASITTGSAAYVTDEQSYLRIASQVWTETENTGYGVYTYENTSTLDVKLEAKDYDVTVELVNPTDMDYSASLEAEDITKASDVAVPAGSRKTVTFHTCLIDGVLNLKFLADSKAVSAEEAAEQSVYVESMKIEASAEKAAGDKPTIFLASDSTVQTYEDYYDPQTGWGEALHNFLGNYIGEGPCDDCNYSQSRSYETDQVIIENRAIGGRSSRSFIEEGKLDDLLEDVKPGDYLLVQWGHNDATSSRPNRYVSPEDFGKWIQYYIDGASQRGASCILVTPAARYSYNADGTFNENFKAYGDVMRSIAAQENIPLADLSAASIALCESFGIEGAKSLFLWVEPGEYTGAYAGGATDSTHLQYYGAYKFAQCVAKEISEISQPEDPTISRLQSLINLKESASVPQAVTGLMPITIGASSVSMQWNASQGAEMYYIFREELTEGVAADTIDFTNAEKYSVTAGTRYTDNGCEGGRNYVYAVCGYNDKGLGEISENLTVTTKSAQYKYDFNYNNSPTMEGWTGVNQNQGYTKEAGYGWIKAPNNGRNRAGNGNADSSAMADDFNLGEGEFAVDLPNGDYEIKVYAGDLLPGTSTIKASYTAEGKAAGGISTKQALASMAASVRVMDGQLNLTVGGSNPYINGLEITPVLLAPSGLNYSEMSIEGNSASFLIGFTGVGEAAAYRIYQKGQADENFTMVKSFTAEEYQADELSCRSMKASLGETYQYYITALGTDGTESAPSNTIEIDMLDPGVKKPAPPANIRCDSAKNGEIKLSWDSTDTAFKYMVYRSDKSEDEKGFKEFIKVGETQVPGFTDTGDDLTANIPYYYKIKAVNAGGAGEFSKVCKTEVTGELIASPAETLTDRGAIAINLAGADGGETVVTASDAAGKEYTSGVYLSWRSFEKDPKGTTFDIYRNETKIAENLSVTNLVDEGGTASDIYRVEGSSDEELGLKVLDTAVWQDKYLELKLYSPADQTMPDGTACTYSANDMSVGDLDGDGQLELVVKWYPSNAQDNSAKGYTGTTFLDGYDVNFATGEVSLLWRIDMGVNIRSGAHYTQFQVWDFDGDGKAEIAVKTADGTTSYQSTDGTDAGLVEKAYVGACNAASLPTDQISKAHDYRNGTGYILEGPEYFTMFNCDDASLIDTVDYEPGRGNVNAWGDGYGNRVDRFLSAVAYLNGTTPSAVFCRGYYTRTCLTAYNLADTDGDGVGDKIKTFWKFDTNEAGSQYEAQGNHGLSVNDIDNDGKDEIIYGALVIDHNGTVKYSTGQGHGDAMHVSDWVNWNEGLEVMAVHEHDDASYHVEIHDAETGKILMGYHVGRDTGRGVAADIDPTASGAEFWSIASPNSSAEEEPSWDSRDGGVYSTMSTLENLITLAEKSPASNASIFWDGDLLSEIQDHRFDSGAYKPIAVNLTKWDYENNQEVTLFDSTQILSNNGTKGNTGLTADILGDWREEIISRCSSDQNRIRIYASTIQTDYVVPCLLENRAYRQGVAWQNVAYNQPANLSYLLSEGLITAQLTAQEDKTASDSLTFTFTPASDGVRGHKIAGYEIYRSEDGKTYKLIDTVSADRNQEVYSYTDKNLETDTMYFYKTAAVVDGKTSYMSKPLEMKTKRKAAEVLYRFDFGISNDKAAEGWIGITVNGKGGSKTNDELGITYSKEKKFGFADGANIITGRSEDYICDQGEIPADVYQDFALPDGNTFCVDVPNGTYQVDIVGGSAYKSTVKGDLEGTVAVKVENGANSYTVGTYEVEVTDGQLNFNCAPKSISRLDAMIITRI
ncbi:rhamnogalacturonan lyase family protein [Robinsoniella peoriensis]|uniref:rhamnogalacturonan lyase family protein n=1 Tax=Robinsoniella peoriensis TaxID=180332 RepID=UPI003629D825